MLGIDDELDMMLKRLIRNCELKILDIVALKPILSDPWNKNDEIP